MPVPTGVLTPESVRESGIELGPTLEEVPRSRRSLGFARSLAADGPDPEEPVLGVRDGTRICLLVRGRVFTLQTHGSASELSAPTRDALARWSRELGLPADEARA